MCAQNRIPKEIMHKVPTTLLHSLEGMEGMEGLDWEKLLKLQCQDGSFLSSPASTAFALMQTNDPNCFKYLDSVVNRFNGGGKKIYIYIHKPIIPPILLISFSSLYINQIMFRIPKHWSHHLILCLCDCLFMLYSVPNVYPVDLFEHIWAVDRLQRLGISRFFRSQIVECVNYVRRYSTKSKPNS